MVRDAVQSINTVFNNKKLRSILEKFRVPIAVLLFAFMIPQLKHPLLLRAFVVSMIGEFIQIWSFGSLKKNKILAFRGPYRLVRNPMYIGRFLVLLGIVLLFENIWLLLLYMVFYIFYVINRVEREERTLRRYFGRAYERYCLLVHRFLPTLKGQHRRDIWYFNWDLFFENNGHLNLMALICCYACFYFFTAG